MPDEISEEDLKDMSAEEIAELQKQNCIFCKIAQKQIPAKIMHEDDKVICVLDINPASEGHILVLPKEHYMIMPHIPEEILGHLFRTVKLMSNTLLRTLQCKGTTVFVANGMAAGQKAPHVLIHIFPRHENDGLVELPKYEMNDEQIEKLKSSLQPYLSQMLSGKPLMRKVEHTKPVKTDAKPEDEKSGNNDTEVVKETKQKKHTVKTEKVGRHIDKALKPSKPGNVSLDDISKLFGAGQ